MWLSETRERMQLPFSAVQEIQSAQPVNVNLQPTLLWFLCRLTFPSGHPLHTCSLAHLLIPGNEYCPAQGT